MNLAAKSRAMVRDTMSITERQVVDIQPIVAALSYIYPELPRQLITQHVMDAVVLEGGKVGRVPKEGD